ncbi:ABC transporter ATP-binding protein [Nocardiopsis valliformis]|uniref:ABC transporter ATP-binding protein n=1 Tax=Nocardiopsis valliformis TaxID=239974 RepID=UPI00034C64BC|nr:ABC transporter ATP-binding protein [Nocardiopsis valliformis]
MTDRSARYRSLPVFLRGFSVGVLLQMLLVLVNSVLVVLPALVGQRLIDDGVLRGDTGLVFTLGGLLVALTLVQAGISYAENVYSSRLGERLTLRIRGDLFAHLHTQRPGFFAYARPGAVVSRIHGDVRGVQQLVSSTVPALTGAVSTLVVAGLGLLLLEWRASLVLLVLAPVMYGLAVYFAPRVRDATQREMGAYADLDTCVTEQFSAEGAEVVRLHGAHDTMAERFVATAARVRAHALRQVRLGAGFGAAVSVTTGLIGAAIYVVGGLWVVSETMTMGTLVAVVALLGRLYGPIAMLSGIKMELVAGLVSFGRVAEIMRFRPTGSGAPVEARPTRAMAEPRPSVVLNGVSFTYPSPERLVVPSLAAEHDLVEVTRGPTLRDIDLTIEPGTTVGLVGRSGAGKSTLARLLTRTWETAHGRVEIAGTDIRDLSADDLQRTVGAVTQETFLFNDTIRANLLFARAAAEEKDLVRVCRAAQIWEMVRNLPDGLDTVVGDRGVRLSGGERQRLALARLFLKAPPVVVLDEATSHLDNETERAVQQAMRTELADRARLVIAHRLATVREADLIVVMADGRIEERGTHEQLMDLGGLYSRLVDAQGRGLEKAGLK